MMKLSGKTVTLVRLAKKMADRFERLAPDAALVEQVRKQAEAVLAEPLQQHLKSIGKKK